MIALFEIDDKDALQSWLIVGRATGLRSDPDSYALVVANAILNARLVKRLRTEEGLAYVVGSRWSPGWDHVGKFVAEASIRSDQTVHALQILRGEIADLTDQPVNDEELEGAKDSVTNSIGFEYDSVGNIVQYVMLCDYYGLPVREVSEYASDVKAVSAAAVQKVALRQFAPDQLSTLVMGPRERFDKPLASVGQISKIVLASEASQSGDRRALVIGNNTASKAQVPSKPTKKPPVSPARALLNRARDAMGGAAIDKIKDYRITGERVMQLDQGPIPIRIENTWNLSGRALFRLFAPRHEAVSGYDGQTAWTKAETGVNELAPDLKSDLDDLIFRDIYRLMQNLDNRTYTFDLLSPIEVDHKRIEGVVVKDTARNRSVNLFFDPSTGLPLKRSYRGMVMGANGYVDEFLSDYRVVDGVKFAYKSIIYLDGHKRYDTTTTAIKVNSGVALSAYTKPQ